MRILLIGAGNVAHQFFTKWKQVHEIDVLHRSDLQEAQWKGAHQTYKATTPKVSYELTVLAVKDDAIETILDQYTIQTSYIVHTSGSVGMEVFQNKGYENYGIFYPLQTFSIGRNLDFKKIPFILEASNTSTLDFLKDLTLAWEAQYYLLNSNEKRQLHLAAVWVCNYTNYMRIIGKNQIDDEHFKLLHPLMKETLNKSLDIGVEKAQTGPAIRKDEATIKKHLELLEGDEKELYAMIAKMIMNDEKL